MDKRHKDIMRTLVSRLRHLLVGTPTDHGFEPGNLDRELERLGIASDGTITPIDALPDPHSDERRTYRIITAQLSSLPRTQRITARAEIIERAAYTWINRLLALRTMEVRKLIDDTLRSDEAYGGLSEKLFFLRQDEPHRVSGADGGWWAVIEDACSYLSTALPGLFALDDPDAALRPTADALVQCIALVNGTQPVLPDLKPQNLDETFTDPDAIGWAYQFYQEEAKAAIDAKCKSGGKVTSRAEIAAKTELFTEPYMVQWLLQNSLGRSYHEAYPQSTLPEAWPYYVKRDREDAAEIMPTFLLNDLTLLDPCMGSGHFLRAAFDMFVAMYREQRLDMSAVDIANRILSHHLHGVDLDPRAAQLSALTLYLRAWELVREEQRKQRKLSTGPYIPPAMNLATTPTGLNAGALQRHLQRYPQDQVLQPLLEGIFQGLEQVDILGSLLRPREYLNNAITALQQPYTIPLDFDQDAAELRRTIIALKDDPIELKRLLLDRVIISFKAESGNTDDVSMALFGREAEKGVRLLQVLDGRYAVVVTNPPYLGSSYMDAALRKYITKNYPSGKRDIYAAFILRCLELCRPNGRVAMVTMQSWMFLRSFAELRAVPEEKLVENQKKGIFTGLLRETSIEVLAHLGANAFEEISGEVVKCVMYVLQNIAPHPSHQIIALRQVSLKSAREKAEYLKREKRLANLTFLVDQKRLLQVTDSIVSVYHLPMVLLELLSRGETVNRFGYVSWGVSSSNNDRFLRLWWEVPISSDRWAPHVKGGGYCKWEGLDYWAVEWRDSGIAIKTFILERYPYLGDNYEIKVRSYTTNTPGWTFSSMVGSGLAVRKLYTYQITNAKSPAIFLREDLPFIGGFLNSVVSTFILRGLTPSLNVDEGYVAVLPIKLGNTVLINSLVNLSLLLKRTIITRNSIEHDYFSTRSSLDYSYEGLLHLIEGIINVAVIKTYDLSERDIQQILDETGTPAGWYPFITGFDILPSAPDNLDMSAFPQELFDYLAAHERINPDNQELARIKANLRTFYEAGPGAKSSEREESIEDNEVAEESEEEIISGAHIPIPTETFLEELSVKMKLHPISVYWLLEELRAEGVRCKPEERRLLEDRLSVLVLYLLGHRWPKQIETGEPLPVWAEQDGIIPLVPGAGKRTLAERLRERLYEEDGALATQQTEALLEELTGQNLEQWLRTTFFLRHISQFKHRPIAWHLASTSVRGANSGSKKKRGGGGQRMPAFECLLYYHACTGDALARIRTQYVEPLLRNERGKIDAETLFAEDGASAIAQERIRELEAFIEKMREIEEHGFACPELQKAVLEEPLDRWSDDGYKRPESHDELRRNEEAWHVDINDGVRVNIAPLQLAGVMAREVLNPQDAKRAIADRVRWRADERRWVREGKLPRCGWMDEQVPASIAWNEREAQRITQKAQPEQQHLLSQQEAHQEEMKP